MYVASANASMAHTTGNVTYILTEFIKGLFAPKFFRHVHVTTRMPYREFMVEENRDRDIFIKKNRPILIVKPTVIMGDDDIFMSYSRFTRMVHGSQYHPDHTGFQLLMRDNIHDVSLSYMVNRLRVQLDVTIMLDTEYAQTNIYSQIRNMWNENQIYWMKTALECFVPRDFIEQISEISGVPIRDPESGSVRNFLDYLMANSNKYFTFKEKNASSKEEFFVYYPITLEYIFTGISKNDMSKHGHVTGSADITFTLSAEFNAIGMYQISTERDDVVERANAVIKMDSTPGVTIIPFFTVQNLFKEVDEKGWRLRYTNMFQLDEDIPLGKPEPLDISPILKDSIIKDVVEYHKKHGISNDILLNIIIMKNNEILNGDRSKGKVSYIIDYDKEEIMIYNRNFSCTYRIIVYVNTLYISTLLGTLNDLDGVYERDMKNAKPKRKVDNDENEKSEEIVPSGGSDIPAPDGIRSPNKGPIHSDSSWKSN